MLPSRPVLPSMPPSPIPRALIGVLALIAVVTAGLLVAPSSTLGAIEAAADDPVTFGFVVAGLYLVRPLFAWPTTPLAIVVGYGYGIALGLPIALVGVVLTVIPVFLAARWIGADPSTDWARLPLGTAVNRTGRAVSAYYATAGPIRGVIVSRLAPIPSDVSTCAAALSGVSLKHLLIGTAIGELPWTIAAVVVGASAATITTDGLGEIGWLLAAGCLIAAALLLSRPVYRVAISRGGESTAG